MPRIILPIIIMVVLVSCISETTEKVPAEPPVVVQEKQLSLPLAIDSAFISTVSGDDLLTYTEVRKMKASIAKIEDEATIQHFINDFCKIDSLKRHDGYLSYVDSLDIGMTEDATVHRLGEITLSPQNKLLLWKLAVRSYEACPVFTGTFVVGTLKNRNSYTHIPLGKLYQVVDPPMFYRQVYTSEINDKWITINSLTESDEDMDTPGEEHQIHCYNIAFKEITANNSEEN